MKARIRAGAWRLPNFQPRPSAACIAKEAALQRALHPARQTVSAEEFDQRLYDAIARDRTMPPAAHLRAAKRFFEVRVEPRAKAAGGGN